jgi:NAD(P)H-dependent FMN reductase
LRPKLNIVICSTRPGRVGPTIARWFHQVALDHDGFDVVLVDLAAIDLPLYDEPNHPQRQNYRHDHTKAWAASVASADAFVFVTPEYNYGTPPSLLNALNYVYKEWNYKPAAFVSYGGIFGGGRAVQMEKMTLNTLKMVPIFEAVVIPWFAKQIDGPDGNKVFTPNEIQTDAAKGLLTELARWAVALKPLRQAGA